MKARLLLVEDDAALARGLSYNLEREGYAVLQAADGAAARAALAAGGLDLVLLDLGLPDADGLELLRELRARDAALPVLCLTARGQETDVVMGLQSGADDYVTKPFGLAELLARVAARLRARRGPAGAGRRRVLGGVTVDLAARKVLRPDGEEELTTLEAELLAYLLQRRGQAVERAQLLRDLWGVQRPGSTRTLDNHVARLRRKLELDPSRPRVLVTVHGTGYRLEEGETESGHLRDGAGPGSRR